MNSASSQAVTIHADPEHDGLRSVVVFQLFILIPLSNWLIYIILNRLPGTLAEYAFSLSCIGGLVLGLGISWIIEHLLKRFWHSGQALTLTTNQVQVIQQSQDAFALALAEEINHLGWYFSLQVVQKTGRERRLPKKWLCVAYQLLRDEDRLIVYTYMSRREMKKWIASTAVAFHELDMEELFATEGRSRFSTPKVTEFPAGLLTGKDGRYWVAERHRSQMGMELTRKDFATFINWMKQYDPQLTV